VPGAVSEGETVDEAREMVLDALHELTAFRLEVAMKGKTAATLVERVSIAF
jgi:predicted RNase H-like HicB family nuclease